MAGRDAGLVGVRSTAKLVRKSRVERAERRRRARRISSTPSEQDATAEAWPAARAGSARSLARRERGWLALALRRALIRRPPGTCRTQPDRRSGSCTSVITNSIMPTAKIVLYSIDAGRHVAAAGGGDERRHRLGRLARVERDGAAAGRRRSATIIVSPTARETPSTNEATIPESAAGNDHPQSRPGTCDAPSAVGALAQRRGTADIASSETDATVGMIMKPDDDPGRERVEDVDVDAERRAGAA